MKHVGVFKFNPADPRFVTFDKFLANHNDDYMLEADAWFDWYVNQNLDASQTPIVFEFDHSKFGEYDVIPGTFHDETSEFHVSLDRVREMNPELDTEELKMEFYQANLDSAGKVFIWKK